MSVATEKELLALLRVFRPFAMPISFSAVSLRKMYLLPFISSINSSFFIFLWQIVKRIPSRVILNPSGKVFPACSARFAAAVVASAAISETALSNSECSLAERPWCKSFKTIGCIMLHTPHVLPRFSISFRLSVIAALSLASEQRGSFSFLAIASAVLNPNP